MASIGLLSIILRSGRCCNMDWKTSSLIFIKNLHKYLAYFCIIGSQVTISTGIMNYMTYNADKMKGRTIFIGTNLVFFTVLITLEVIYRIKRKKEVEFEADEDIENITKSDFHDMVHN